MGTGPDGAQVLGVNEGTDSSLRVAATLQDGGDDDLYLCMAVTMRDNGNGTRVPCVDEDTHLSPQEIEAVQRAHDFAWSPNIPNDTCSADLQELYKWNKVNQLLQQAAPSTVPDDPEHAWLEALAATGICDTAEGREPMVCATIDEAPAPTVGQRPLLPAQLAIPHLAEQQRADPLLGEVFRVLETPESERHELWLQSKLPGAQASLRDFAAECWIDAAGLLRRGRTQQRGTRRTRAPTDAPEHGVLCVPEGLRKAVISLYHDSMHSGVHTVIEAVSKAYWWPTLASDCKVYTDMCHVCKSVRTSTAAIPESTGRFERAMIPGEQYVVDILGRLPETKQGYKYVLVAVDRSSRWVCAIPMRDNTTQCVLDALLILLQTRGTPQFLFPTAEVTCCRSWQLKCTSGWGSRKSPWRLTSTTPADSWSAPYSPYCRC
jgi:hypothetical protein